jgi:hypothetical protein
MLSENELLKSEIFSRRQIPTLHGSIVSWPPAHRITSLEPQVKESYEIKNSYVGFST